MMSRRNEDTNTKREMKPNPLEWVEIVDPQTQNIIYANPATGECSWDKPKTGYIKERSPEGEWWELFDKKHKLPYYYNTLSKKTVWVRPNSGLIIPLTKIQTVALSTRNSAIRTSTPISANKMSEKCRSKSSNLEVIIPKTQLQDLSDKTKSRSSVSSPSNKLASLPNSPSPRSSPKESTLEPLNSPTKSVKQKNPSNLSIKLQTPVDEARPGSMFTSPSKNELAEIKAETPTKSRASYFEQASKSAGIVEIAKKNGIGSPVLDKEAAKLMSPMTGNNYKNPCSPSTASIPPKSLPDDLISDINQFQIDGFAKKFFSTHKKGLFRKKVPLEKLLVWSDDSISQPLIALSKNLHKDALRCFKLIQRIMGDRAKGKGTSEDEDIQWLVERGIDEAELRDEMYVQICKQLSDNPRESSQRLGWELLSVLVICFPPSKNFENYLRSFIKMGFNHENQDISLIAKHCGTKLIRTCKIGPKGKPLSIGEIEQARKAAFHLSVFGENLDLIMEHQREKFPDLKLPKVLPFLANAVLDLNGVYSEGIFRVPGDMEMVSELKLRIDKENYSMDGITDCNVPASLFKQFLRDLEEPLIPQDKYYDCINSKTHQDALAVIDKLSYNSKRVAKYVLKFLQKFTTEDSIKATKMSAQNIAMVFAPSFLRCPSNNLTEVFANSKHEQEFMRVLIIEGVFKDQPL